MYVQWLQCNYNGYVALHNHNFNKIGHQAVSGKAGKQSAVHRSRLYLIFLRKNMKLNIF